jgi:hypothetical protein
LSYKFVVLCKTSLPVWATSRQCCTRHHCRLDGQENTTCLSLEPTVLVEATLLPWATNQQCWSIKHCRLEPQTAMLAQLDTAGQSLEATVISPYHWRFLVTGSDVNPHHCQYATVGSKSVVKGGFELTLMS